MAKSWSDVRRRAASEGRLDEARVAGEKKRLLSEMRAHRLAELRKAYGLNQEEMAERLRISQSRVSRIERGQLEQSQVATLKAYIESLGGELELSARFGSERITLG
jgi:predicted transcriptional regulator